MKRDATGKFVQSWNLEAKQRINISLTNTAWRSLNKEAQKQGISPSEVIEHFARSLENQDAIAQGTEHKVALILESITDAFVAFDRDWRYTYVNQAAAQVLHKTPEELIDKQVWQEIFPELVGGIAYQAMHRALAEQVPVSWEEFAEPVQRWLEARACPSADGVAVYFRDVTERKQVEIERERLLRKLEIQHAQFEAVLRQMPAGVLIADRASRKLVLANEQAKHIVGYDYDQSLELEDDLSIAPFATFHSDGQPYAPEEYPLARSLKSGEVVTNEEMEIHREDGSCVFINIHSTPISDYQGQIVAAVAIFQDITERKLIEQALQERESRLRGLVDGNLIGVIVADFQGNILEVNDAWLATLGYTREEVLSGAVNFHEITPPEFRHLDQQAIAEMQQVGRHAPFEKEYFHKNGRRVPVLVGTAYLGGLNNLGIGFLIDLTERKRLESALQEREQQFKMVAENAPDIISRIDAAFRHLYVSPSVEKVTGISADQFIGKTHAELGMPAEIYGIWHDSLQQAFESGQEQTIEFQFPTLQGIRWYQSRLVPEFTSADSMTSVVTSVLTIARDVTDYKQVEQALRESEERLRLALAAAQTIVWDMDLQTNQVICSTNALGLWGLQAGTAADFFALIHPDDRPRVMQAAARAASEGESSYAQEYRVISPDSTVHWLNSQGRIYLDNAGRGVRMIGVSVDVTERKQTEAERTAEITAQVEARQRIEQLLAELQRKERQQQFLIELNDAIRAIQDSSQIIWQVISATGQHFDVTRCTYGEIDATQQYVIVDRDYCNGVISLVGKHHLDSFGPEIIAELKQGQTVVVEDVDRDLRSAGVGVAAFEAIQTKSLLCVPLVKEEKFVALLVLHHAAPRSWTVDDIALMERIAQKTWLAVERSRAEEKLRESEAHLQLAVTIGRMGTWDWDMETGALLWGGGHFTVLGLQPYECEPSYELWVSRVHPQDLAGVEAQLQQAITEQRQYHHEYRLRWTDGSIHWVEARGQFIYDTQGNPKRSIGVVIEITERKQAEQEREQLLERERIARAQVEATQRQLENLFNTSPIGIALLDSEQRFIAINAALAEINGLTREQHLGYSIPELFRQSDPDLMKVFEQIYTTGNAFISPNFAVNVPGRSDRRPGYYNVYYLPTVNANHQVESVLVYVVDVTERVRLERAQQFLSEASAVLASSLDYQTTLERVAQLTVPELADWCIVHMVEEDGTIDQIAVAHIDPAKLQWADRIQKKYPVNLDDPRGAALTLRTGQSDFIPEISGELLVQVARDPEHLEILRQVGLTSVMTVPLRTQSQVTGVISFISAESGRRYTPQDLQLAEELARRASLAIDNAQLYRAAQRDRAASEAARTVAEAANRIKDEFLAVLSHELRSPLNPILGWTKMLRSKRLDATKTEQALETIERNAKLQAQLIEDLLDVSRILQGKMSLNVAPVNLAATIQAALETVRLAAEAKHIQIQTTLHSVSGTVLGETNRLQQIIWNLLANAVKFTSSGGRVEVRLEQVGTYAQLQVQDTGRGISPEFLPHVFDYFRQQDGTTTRHFGGLGLGLAIVRQLTELHGGTVWAESPGPNLGATFTVRLPLNIIDPAAISEVEGAENTMDLSHVRILVVDDEADMRELASFILTQSGAQVTTAASAIQALTLLNQSVPDLLLCDIGMPEMDGYSLIRQVRKWSSEQGGTIPAIALTAYAGEINQQQALAAGFQMHISKPVEPEVLIEAIASLLAANS